MKAWGEGAIGLTLFLKDAPLPEALRTAPVFGAASAPLRPESASVRGRGLAIAGSGGGVAAITGALAVVGRAAAVFEQHEVVLAGECEQPVHVRRETQQMRHENAARPGRDLLSDVVEIGLPAVFFVQVISVQSDFDFRENRGIERIVGARGQQVVARIEQRGQADVHRLADAGGDEDILNAGDALAGRFAANGVERRRDARRTRISILAVAHGFVDGFNHVSGRLEIKVERVADVERQNFVSFPGDLVGDAGQVANGVADVFQAGGWGDLAQLGDGHEGILPAATLRAQGKSSTPVRISARGNEFSFVGCRN